MVAYQFYLNDGSEEPNLIAILPERRRKGERVTQRSIMKWGQLAAGTHVDPNRIYFVQINL